MDDYLDHNGNHQMKAGETMTGEHEIWQKTRKYK